MIQQRMINAVPINPHYYYPEGEAEQADKFFAVYELELEQNCAAAIACTFKDRKVRVCRFCHKKSPFVSFNKDAHVISELLGNKTYISDFECDDCNGKFGRYENELASYLGIVRTVQSVKGKKVPKFKSADRTLDVVSTVADDITNQVKFRRYDSLDKTFEFDKENNLTIIHYKKATYTPLSVYKALLKMALSVMPPQHLANYRYALEYLITKKYDDNFSGFAILTRYMMPLTFQFPSPTMMLFKKKNGTDNLFTHVFVLYALNSIFQIVIPFNILDRPLFMPGSSGVDTFWCPPLFGNPDYYEVAPISSLSFDLNSTVRVQGEIESLRIPAQEGDFDISKIFNKDTGEIIERKFDASKIIGIDLMMREVKNRL